MKKYLTIVHCFCFLLVFCLLLCGCSGGSDNKGGSGSTYTGETGQVIFSVGNTQTIAESTMDALFGGTSQIPFLSGVTAENSNNHLAAVPFERHLIRKMFKKESESNANEILFGVAGGYTEEGECGGSMTITGNDGSDRPGNVSIDATASFNNYCECMLFDWSCANQLKSNGTINAKGSGVSVYDEDLEEYCLESANLSLTLSNLNVKLYTDSTLQANITINGTVQESFTDSGDEYVSSLIMDVVREDKLNNTTVWLNNLTLNTTEDWYSSGVTMTINGRIYYQQYGYVDIRTQSTITISSPPHPDDGILILSGSNKAKLRITFSYYSYEIDADLNGDGVYEYDLGTFYW